MWITFILNYLISINSCLLLFSKGYKMESGVIELRSRKVELERELTKINKALSALEPIAIEPMQWKEKALNCLDSKDHICTTIEILECLMGAHEVKHLDDATRKRYITALSVMLLDQWKVSNVIKFNVKGFKGYFYGLPSWFDGASLKDKYYPKRLKNIIEKNKFEMIKRP